jgi:tetraacyldisaccharide 4'-kinase
VRPLPLADHFDFASLPWPPGTTDVVVTEKDATKLLVGRAMGARVWVATLDFRPEDAFGTALLERLASLDAPEDAMPTTRPLTTTPLPLEH